MRHSLVPEKSGAERIRMHFVWAMRASVVEVRRNVTLSNRVGKWKFSDRCKKNFAIAWFLITNPPVNIFEYDVNESK